MKKYLFLLVVPLLFFSVGCDDDDSDDTIPVSEYPESILGNWKLESTEDITITHNVEINPIYGTETYSTTQNESILISPFNSVFPEGNWSELRVYSFEYDGDCHWNLIPVDTLDNVLNEEGCILTSYFYNINGDVVTFYNNNGYYELSHIEYLSSTNLQINSEFSDTSEIINDSYVITRNIIQNNYSRYNPELNLSSCFD